MNQTQYVGWVRCLAAGNGPWHVASRATNRKEAENLASDWASQRGWRFVDIVALPAGQLPVGRLAAT